MSKNLAKPSFISDYKKLKSQVSTIARNPKELSALTYEIAGAAEMTSEEIDKILIINFNTSPEELNGFQLSDPSKEYFLVRQAGFWRKIKTEKL